MLDKQWLLKLQVTRYRGQLTLEALADFLKGHANFNRLFKAPFLVNNRFYREIVRQHFADRREDNHMAATQAHDEL